MFHVYFFCFPYGFAYLAWLTIMLFILHTTMHLTNYYEIPAFNSGKVNMITPRVGLMDAAAVAEAIHEARMRREAQIRSAESGAAVFRRMQALRRAAQLADAAADAALRGRTRASSTQEQSRQRLSDSDLAGGAAGGGAGGEGGRLRPRTTSADGPSTTSKVAMPKSKFACGPIPPRRRDRAASLTDSPSTGAGAGGDSKSSDRARKSALPVLALGRTDSMAEYTDNAYMQMRQQQQAEEAKQAKEQQRLQQALQQQLHIDNMSVPRSTSNDDYGFYDDEDDTINNGQRSPHPAAASSSSSSSYAARQPPVQYEEEAAYEQYTEEQEDEERRFFVFGAVTGASTLPGDDTGAPARRRNNSSSTSTPARKKIVPYTESKPVVAANIFETVEARRSRLEQEKKQKMAAGAGGGAGGEFHAKPGEHFDSATTAALLRNMNVGKPKQAAGGSRANKETLSDYGFKSQEFSVFGELLKK
jgi:hypothetical protein